MTLHVPWRPSSSTARAAAVALLALLAGCKPGSVAIGDEDKITGPDPEVSLSGPAVIDPAYGGAISFALTKVGGETVTIEVRDATGAVVEVLADGTAWADAITWDARDEGGLPLALGRYTVHAELEADGASVATAEQVVDVVRVGVSAGTLGGDRIPLLWHAAGGAGMYWSDGGDTATFTLAGLDIDGDAAEIPAPWDDLFEPPETLVGANLPAAYAWDARPTLSLVLGGDVGAASLTPSIAGWTFTSGRVAPGETLVFTADAPLAAGPGVVEQTLTLQWMAGADVVGVQEVPLRMYALLGPPAFDQSGDPYAPWLAVIDPALRAMAGVAPTDQAVISALVEHIYRDLGLSYDTRSGASAYTQYEGWSFDNAHLDLSSFLSRGRGSVVNCTDCAALLEAFANMLGANLSYTIIVQNFPLNYIKAIGGDAFDHCPFGGTGCSFSYHAVTTPDDTETIYDATLALDGDDDPTSYPGVELLVQGISGDEYLERLVLSGYVRYDFTQKETIQ